MEVEYIEMVKIFIVGKHRSGTSWLGNILSEHPEIYGVQNPDRHGIWESLYFTYVAELFRDVDTSTESGFEKWIEFMSRTNYVRFSSLSPRALSELGPAPFEVLFARLMDYASREKGARIWIEKSPPHTLVASHIAEIFPEAHFIAITRQFDDWLRSSVRHSKRTGRLVSDHRLARVYLIAKLVFERFLYESEISFLEEEYGNRVIHINYEDLIERHEEVKKSILSFIGAKSVVNNIKSKYKPNSSFSSESEKKKKTVISSFEWKWAYIVQKTVSMIPINCAMFLKKVLLRIRDIRGRPKLDWYFDSKK